MLLRGRLGEVCNIGGDNEWTNIDIVTLICDRLDTLQPCPNPYRELITFVRDRPGHDRRYAFNSTKMQAELGWSPAHRFETGIPATLDGYLANLDWCDRVRSGEYRQYLET